MMDFLSSLSQVLTFIVAAVAAYAAWKQWSGQKEDKELRNAAGLSAWWAHDESRREWGVQVANSSDSPFMNVEINAAANGKPKDSFTVKLIPPGVIFIPSEPSTTWKQPRRATEEQLTPITNSSKHDITKINFADYRGKLWQWTQEKGTQPVKASK
ncbi:hypothetical protein [Jonesia quinghaiensis]|uniref:hypothetical protein n=1 Tax=Jonesia quinghaiensis TaxID=262806 RepID=UPI000490CE54|nr:hypothetical protein [Jonesia quinghaiensis]